MPFAGPGGLAVRAEQQQSLAESAATSRRAMLGLVAAGIASGSLVQTVLAETKAPLVGHPSHSLAYRPVKIAGIAGSISHSAISKQLIDLAIILAESIPGLEVEYIDIDSLPLFNLDLVHDGKYPEVVQTFMDQIGIRPDVYFINKPELFINVKRKLFDKNGNITDGEIEEEFRELLISLRNFTNRLRPCPQKYSHHHCGLIAPSHMPPLI
ncbi:UNVERIFIED_CONTAM: NADPH:quinone oxidoreductase [Sesamum angustifolium]|uniref:NADPH:quinone oxidoreductase n=1 Tax=Sesamum angustifolium TaxID=2727405 RepID=A0AAW2IRX4_9LAMI